MGPEAQHAHQLLPYQQRVEHGPRATPRDDLLDHHIVLVARTFERLLEAAGPVGPPTLGEIIESDRRPALGRAAYEVAAQGNAVGVDHDVSADAGDGLQVQGPLGSGPAVASTLVAVAVGLVQPDAARTPFDPFG